MKIQWNPMETCPRNKGDKVMILFQMGWPFEGQILPLVGEWCLYLEGGNGDIPQGYWRILPNGFTQDARSSKELGWLPLESFLPNS